MKLLTLGIFFIIFGLLIIIFRKQLARSQVDWHYKNFGVRISEKGCKISALVGGLISVLIGIWTLLQVIKFK